MRAKRRRAILAQDERTHADPRGQIMVRYFYAFMPLVIVVGTVLLASPFLALIALMIVSLVPAAALAWAVVSVYTFGRGISRRWHSHLGASPRTATLSPAKRRAT
jgi:hypothetical protein